MNHMINYELDISIVDGLIVIDPNSNFIEVVIKCPILKNHANIFKWFRHE